MINFSITQEYSIDEEFLKESNEEEYHIFTETRGESIEDFLLHMLEIHGPEALGADPEYSETVVF